MQAINPLPAAVPKSHTLTRSFDFSARPPLSRGGVIGRQPGWEVTFVAGYVRFGGELVASSTVSNLSANTPNSTVTGWILSAL